MNSMKTANDHSTATMQEALIITRTFSLTAATIWEAWSEPKSFKKWWGPKEYDCPFCSINFKVGGNYLASMRLKKDGTEIWSTGQYKEIIPQQKIVYTDSFADSKGNVVDAGYYKMPAMPVETQVTVTLQDIAGRTMMTLQHQGIPGEMQEDCRKGWQSSFDKMEAI
jgi:uncharacterized protein YndB with AHSA1/START domain